MWAGSRASEEPSSCRMEKTMFPIDPNWIQSPGPGATIIRRRTAHSEDVWRARRDSWEIGKIERESEERITWRMESEMATSASSAPLRAMWLQLFPVPLLVSVKMNLSLLFVCSSALNARNKMAGRKDAAFRVLVRPAKNVRRADFFNWYEIFFHLVSHLEKKQNKLKPLIFFFPLLMSRQRYKNFKLQKVLLPSWFISHPSNKSITVVNSDFRV